MSMMRANLFTKEEMDEYVKGNRGKQKSKEEYMTMSVNDDCDYFYQKLRQGEETREDIISYLFQKLKNEEMNLVDKKSLTYLKTLCVDHSQQYWIEEWQSSYEISDEYIAESWRELWPKADVDPEKMERSESDSKFLKSYCCRATSVIN